MQYYATFDENGSPTAFYPDDVHPSAPDGAVQITEEQWREFIDNQGLRRWQNGTVVIYTPPAPAAEPTRVTQRQIRLALIDAGVTLDPDAWIDSLIDATTWDDKTKAKAKSDWRHADYIARDYPLLNDAAATAQAGVTAEQIDGFFALALTEPA